METIHILIGDVRTLEVENWQIVPDDRQQQIEIVGGSVVQDFGHIEEGDTVSCSVTVLADGWETIKGYWDNRQKVNVSDEAGIVWSDMRVVVKSYEYVPYFPKAIKATLEFWRN